jgi:hypothetical protein
VLKNDIAGGDGVKARITKNGTVIWPTSGTPQTIAYNDNAGYDTSLDSVSVSTGDRIRFEVNNGGSGSTANDTTSWTPAIGIGGSVVSSPLYTTVEVSSEASTSLQGSNAVDDWFDSYWQASGSSVPQWLKYDLGAVYALNAVSMRFPSSATWKYKLEGSTDNSNWSMLADRTGTGVIGDKSLDSVTGSYRYVRATITYVSSGSAGITEIRVYKDTGFVTLLSGAKPVTASSTSASQYSADKAADSDASSYWCASSGSMPQSLVVDLGNPYFVTNAEIEFVTSDVWSYKIEGSIDNVDWVGMVDKTTGAVQCQFALERMAGCYRYVRLTITGSGSNWAAVKELKIFGSPEVRALLSQGKTTTTSSSSGSANNGSKAVDNDEDSYWCASNGTKPQWLTVDLGQTRTLGNIRTAFYVPDTWQYKLEASTDNTNWTFLTNSWDAGVYWADPDFDDVVHGGFRYVRLTVNKADTNWVAVKEFRVFGPPVELSAGATASASTTSGAGFAASKANDGDTGSYWCASSGTKPQWLTLDLGSSQTLSQSTVRFFGSDTWKYKIEGSTNNSTWTMLSDRTSAGVVAQEVSDALSGSYRYVRISVTDAVTNWAAIREFKIY